MWTGLPCCIPQQFGQRVHAWARPADFGPRCTPSVARTPRGSQAQRLRHSASSMIVLCTSYCIPRRPVSTSAPHSYLVTRASVDDPSGSSSSATPGLDVHCTYQRASFNIQSSGSSRPPTSSSLYFEIHTGYTYVSCLPSPSRSTTRSRFDSWEELNF